MMTVKRVNQLTKDFGLSYTSPDLIRQNKGPAWQHLATILCSSKDQAKILMGFLILALVKSKERTFYIQPDMIHFLIEHGKGIKKVEYSPELFVNFLVKVNQTPAFKLLNRAEGRFKIVSECLLREIREQEGH